MLKWLGEQIQSTSARISPYDLEAVIPILVKALGNAITRQES